ncbi:hypothetical protein ABPG77_005859 [Micractinium sp. CCAP 211/92]
MFRKHESPGLRLVVTLVHLALFAQLGVATRVFLDKFMVLGCGGSWGPCIQGGAYFKDIASNMLGSFVIGLFAASSVLGLATDRALAILPKGHPWQSNLELQIGIRTGYCGSLTTFASWNLELVTDAVESHQWVNMLLGLITGLFASIALYMMGMHAALAIDRWLIGDTLVFEEQRLYRENQVAYIEGLRASSGETPAQQLMEQAEPDIPRLRSGRILSAPAELLTQQQQQLLEQQQIEQQQQQQRQQNGALEAGNADEQAPVDDGGAAAARLLSRLSHRLQQRVAEQAAEEEWERGQKEKESEREREAAQAGSKPLRQALTPGGLAASLAGHRTDGAALLLLLLLTALLAVGVGLESEHQWLRQAWMSCLLGPPGCILRWWLSRWNYQIKGRWQWYPAGTFAANMLGTATPLACRPDCFCILQRESAASLGYWGGLMVGAVQVGFCGSLTTVSTYVTEIVKFADAIPENYHAYTYTLLSTVGGLALGLGIYAGRSGLAEW